MPGGDYDLAVRRVGYQPQARRLSVTVRDSIPLDVALSPAPMELPEVVAIAKARHDAFWAPIEERMRKGIGSFLDETLLRKSEDKRLRDLLQAHTPGLKVHHLGTKAVAYARGEGPGGCAMAVWVDGIRIWAPQVFGTPTPPPDLDQWQPADLQAVEVYVGPARTPMEFQVTGSACGSLVIWTRHR